MPRGLQGNDDQGCLLGDDNKMSKRASPKIKKLTKRQEQKLHYKATHKLLCSKCEGTTPMQLMLKHMDKIPFLVKSKCKICGYDGMFVEVPLN